MGATPEGTKSYPHRTPPVLLGATGWSISPVGFGSYRIHPAVPEHREALRLALQSGCNLIDTSTNYGDGGSEKLIGETLRELFSEGALRREQVVVVTKAGYLQGENLKLARQRSERGIPFPEVVEYSDDCWHCIAPEFLKDQITRSLSRLGLKQIDVLLLHNPEYFLKSEGEHAEYYRRLSEALSYLETEAQQGRIQYYGISSNTFPMPKDAPDFTSLEVIRDLAREKNCSRFSVIQFPFNLYEADAALETNNQGKSLLEAARAWNLGTLINRPLNAFYGNKLIRLADFPAHSGKDTEEELKDAFLHALQVESEYRAKDILPAREVAWAHILQANFEKISGLDAWKSILEYQIEPAIENAGNVLSEHAEHAAWLLDYSTALQSLLSALTQYFEQLTALLSSRIKDALDQTCPILTSSPTLSRKAIRVLRSMPGVDCVLVGMRKAEYVQDALAFDPLLSPDEAMAALEAIQGDIAHGKVEH